MNIVLSLSPAQVAQFLAANDFTRGQLITPILSAALVDVLERTHEVVIIELPEPEVQEDPLKELLDACVKQLRKDNILVGHNKIASIKCLREFSRDVPDLFTKAGFGHGMLGLAEAKGFVEKHELYLDGRSQCLNK